MFRDEGVHGGGVVPGVVDEAGVGDGGQGDGGGGGVVGVELGCGDDFLGELAAADFAPVVLNAGVQVALGSHDSVVEVFCVLEAREVGVLGRAALLSVFAVASGEGPGQQGDFDLVKEDIVAKAAAGKIGLLVRRSNLEADVGGHDFCSGGVGWRDFIFAVGEVGLLPIVGQFFGSSTTVGVTSSQM